eukprot:COSAG01_NODE_45916_length_405_cov_0.539216_2_plen_63_part_01
MGTWLPTPGDRWDRGHRGRALTPLLPLLFPIVVVVGSAVGFFPAPPTAEPWRSHLGRGGGARL